MSTSRPGAVARVCISNVGDATLKNSPRRARRRFGEGGISEVFPPKSHQVDDEWISDFSRNVAQQAVLDNLDSQDFSVPPCPPWLIRLLTDIGDAHTCATSRGCLLADQISHPLIASTRPLTFHSALPCPDWRGIPAPLGLLEPAFALSSVIP